MKKFTLFMLVALLSVAVYAQNRNYYPSDGYLRSRSTAEKVVASQSKDATYHLTARLSSDDYEVKRFFYDDQDRVVRITDSSGTDQYIDTIFYNDQGLVSGFSGKQLLNGVWKEVYRVYYAYDEKGNLIQRTNFNSMGTETFTQGGVYDYYFDDQNRPTGHVLYLGDYQYLCESAQYYYDDNGYRVLDVTMSGYVTLDSSSKTYYEYDMNGRLTTQNIYLYNGTGWEQNNTHLYEYDYAGNCLDHSIKNNLGQYVNRRLYEYNAVGSSDVNMPYNLPELYLPEAYDDANMRILEKWYAADADQVLQYVCDYYYIYNDLPWSVESYDKVSLQIAPNPTSDFCVIRSEEAPIHQVMVFNISGALLDRITLSDYSCTLNLLKYPAGIYLVRTTLQDGQLVVSKIIRR